MSVKAAARAPVVPIAPPLPDDNHALDAAKFPEPESKPFSCNECGGPYVMHEDDKVCASCGLLCGIGTEAENEDVDPWNEWHDHRRDDDEIGGFYGEDRVKMVGGFTGPWFWDDEDDEYLAGSF